MTSTLLVVRPEPGLSATVAAAQDMGLNAIGYPLFEVRPCAWEGPDPAAIDALLIGSANAIRHGGDELARYHGKPVLAVGEATADAARAAGFRVVATGSGGLQALLDEFGGPSRMLRIAGKDHVTLRPPERVTITPVIAYETVPLELPEPLRALQDLGLTVLLHSAAAAEQFTRESKRLALNRNTISLIVIGPRVAAAAGEGWGAIHVSPHPSDRAMLELAREMCI